MSKDKLRIVFLGTPEFAVASLKAIYERGYHIVGVITAPDRKGGRGLKQTIESEVKKYAISKGLNILQPTNLKSKDFQKELESLKANLQIVVAFRMLPEAVWNMPNLGTYNLHGSLLPKYRGAAPINWAIINGESTTGVTTFKLKHKIDTGSIAYQRSIDIGPGEYLDVIYNRLMLAGADLVLKTINDLENNTLNLKEQNESLVSHAPKIFHKDCEIEFKDSARSIYNHIRGLSPYPVAWTKLDGKKIKAYKAKYTEHRHNEKPGTWISDAKNFLGAYCINGIIFFTEAQLEGKKRMKIRDLLNGLNLKQNKNTRIVIMPNWNDKL